MIEIDRCYLGDCRDSMRRMLDEGGAGTVQTIVTSPPYWGLRDYGVDGQIGLEPTLAEFMQHLVEVFDLCRELLSSDGTLWLNMGDCYMTGAGRVNTAPGGGTQGERWTGIRGEDKAPCRGPMQQPNRMPQAGFKPKDLAGQPWRLAFALQDAGWYLRQDIIWHKPNPMPESVRDRCTKSHEYLFLLTKNERYYFDQESIFEPVSTATIARLAQNIESQDGSTRANGGTKTNGNMKAVGSMETRNKRSVWTIPTESYSEAHFATFPQALVEPCILAGSRPGDLVFDPFLGSGTVAQVAQRLGRHWIGCELNPEYIELQHDRTRQLGLLLGAA